MKYIICVISLYLMLIMPVEAFTIAAPSVPPEAADIMPPESLGLADRLQYLLQQSIHEAQPQVAAGIKLCTSILGITLLFSMLNHVNGRSRQLVELGGVVSICMLLFGCTNTMLQLGLQTVQQISQYGSLLLPALTAALAAQGGSVSAAALYSATAMFDAVICKLITAILLPMISIFLVLSAVGAATMDDFLFKLRDLLKQLMSWSLKLLLYVFTAFISISGLISGTADQTAIKAAKLTISSVVPVVGGILSDASESILIGAGIAKNAVGSYGLFGILAVTIIPFITVGVHYLLLKLTATLSAAFSTKSLSSLLNDFSSAMGLILAMTGSVCLIQLISIVCFLRGLS